MRTLTDALPIHNSDNQHEMLLREDDHVPWNKRRLEIASSILSITAHRLTGHWITITATETTTSHKGNVQSRTIHFKLNPAEAKKFGEFIANT